MLGDLGASSFEALGRRPRHRRRPRARDRQRPSARRDRGRAREPAGRPSSGPPGVSIVHEQYAELLSPPGGDPAAPPREQFGFSDGAAQPAIDGRVGQLGAGGWRAARRRVLAAPRARRVRARLSRRGHARRSADAGCRARRVTHSAARGRTWSTASSARTWRCSGARFATRRRVSVMATRSCSPPRWSGGGGTERRSWSRRSALTRRFRATAPGSNAFRYLDVDVDGKRCPLGAHIRRSNPRDALGWRGLDDSGLLSFRHRIIRRGVPYGPPLAGGFLEDDGHRPRARVRVLPGQHLAPVRERADCSG